MFKTVKRSYLVAAGFSIAVALWMLSGVVAGKHPETAVEGRRDATAEKPMMVKVRAMEAKKLSKEVVIHGKTEPARTVNLRAETSGLVASTGAAKGGRVKKGEAIIRLEMREREERLVQAKAMVRQRELEYASAKNLEEQGFASRLSLAQSLTLLESARADLRQMEVDIKNTVIAAPFDGVLQMRKVEVGDFVDRGDRVATVIEINPMVVSGEVPELEVADISVGLRGEVTLVSGKKASGKIRYVSSQADEATRTYSVEVEIPNPSGEIPAGMTAEITIPLREVAAHLTSAANLSLDENGIPGVKTLDDKGTVVFHPARIISSGPEGVWLAGLPEKIRLITMGQAFVKPGARAVGIPENADAKAK